MTGNSPSGRGPQQTRSAPPTPQQKRTSIQLKQERARTVDDLRDITSGAERENRGLNTEERGKFDRLDASIRAMSREIEVAEEAEKRDAENAVAIRGSGSGLPQATRSAAKGGPTFLMSRREYDARLTQQRGFTSSDISVLLHDDDRAEVLDRLREKSVLLAAGPRVINTDDRVVVIPRLNASVSVGATRESEQIAESKPELDDMRIEPIKFAARVTGPNEAFDDSQPEIRRIIEDDLRKVAADTLDREFLAGTGTAGGNLGLLGLRNTADVTAGPSLGANGGVPTLDTALEMIEALEAKNADVDSAAFFMHPEVWSVLRRSKDAQERYQLSPDPSAFAGKKIHGRPVFTTPKLVNTETQGTASNTSSMLLVDMSKVVVVVRKAVEVKYSEEERFSFDETVVRLITRVGLGVTRPEGIVRTTGAKAR